VAASIKTGARWKKRTLSRGAEVRVTGFSKGTYKLQVGMEAVFAPAKAIEAACAASTAATPVAPAGPAPIVPEHPATTSAATTTPSAEVPAAGGPAFGATEKIKLAVMDLGGAHNLPTETVTSLGNAVAETLEGMGPFKAISSADIRQALTFAANQQALGCDSMSCMAELGGALGADYLVTGGITYVDGTYVSQLILTSVRDSRVESRVSREYRGDTHGLFEELKSLSRMLVRNLLGQRSGRLVLTASEEGATVEVDGAILGTTPMAPIEVGGGMHEVLVRKASFVVFRKDVEIQQGGDNLVTATLIPSNEFIADYRAAAQRTRLLGWASLGSGVALGAGAGVLWYFADQGAAELDRKVASYNRQEVRTSRRYDRLEARETRVAILDGTTLVAAVVGAVGIATGVTLLLTGDDPSRYDGLTSAAVIGLRPSPVGNGLGVSFGGAF
jgi:hypothetical protein